MRVEFEGNMTANPPQQNVTIAAGSAAIVAIKAASLLHPCYRIETKATSWGPSVQSICQKRVNHSKKQYWMFYVGTKRASTGIGSYLPKAGECIVMKYEKLNFKK